MFRTFCIFESSNIKAMQPLKLKIAPPSKSKLHPLDGFLSKLRFFAKIGKVPACGHFFLLLWTLSGLFSGLFWYFCCIFPFQHRFTTHLEIFFPRSFPRKFPQTRNYSFFLKSLNRPFIIASTLLSTCTRSFENVCWYTFRSMSGHFQLPLSIVK